MTISRRTFVLSTGAGALAALLPRPASSDVARSPDDVLRQEARRGLASRLPGILGAQRYQSRLEEELNVITQHGATSTLLFAHEVVSWAKSRNIPVGPGRGSAPGSLVCWALGITDVDPIRHDLLFERFLNWRQQRQADIDIDFCPDRRCEVIDHLIGRYGRDHAALTLPDGNPARDALWIAAPPRMDYDEVERLLHRLPEPVRGRQPRLAEIIAFDPELSSLYQSDTDVRRWFDEAIVAAEDPALWFGHGRAIAISSRPLSEVASCQPDQAGRPVLLLTGEEAERNGLFTFDCLGLRALTAIGAAKGRIGDPDESVWEIVAEGDTEGVFQLESSGMRELLRQVRPQCLEDVAATTALYRPGPLESGMVDAFIDSKHGYASVVHSHAAVSKILEPTYGIVVYQEQVMRIAAAVAGFDFAQADLMRRALGKKKHAEVERYEREFVDGALRRGIAIGVAEETFGLLVDYVSYTFNRSHAIAYATLTMQTAWLKVHAPGVLARLLERRSHEC